MHALRPFDTIRPHAATAQRVDKVYVITPFSVDRVRQSPNSEKPKKFYREARNPLRGQASGSPTSFTLHGYSQQKDPKLPTSDLFVAKAGNLLFQIS